MLRDEGHGLQSFHPGVRDLDGLVLGVLGPNSVSFMDGMPDQVIDILWRVCRQHVEEVLPVGQPPILAG